MPLWDSEQHWAEASSRQGSHHKDRRFKHHWLKPHALATWEHAGSSSTRTGGILQLSAAGSCSTHQDGTCHPASQRWRGAKAEVTELRRTGVSGAHTGHSARIIKHPGGMLGKIVPLQTGWMQQARARLFCGWSCYSMFTLTNEIKYTIDEMYLRTKYIWGPFKSVSKLKINIACIIKLWFKKTMKNAL